MRLKNQLICLLAFLCAGCTAYDERSEDWFEGYPDTQPKEVYVDETAYPQYDGMSYQVVTYQPQYTALREVEPYREGVIALQNLDTRVLVYCYNVPEFLAEDCARTFERKGFVRLQEIPRQTAKYDFLTGGTYPTRRWRNDELVPRW